MCDIDGVFSPLLSEKLQNKLVYPFTGYSMRQYIENCSGEFLNKEAFISDMNPKLPDEDSYQRAKFIFENCAKKRPRDFLLFYVQLVRTFFFELPIKLSRIF